jgi:hypothetical protein
MVVPDPHGSVLILVGWIRIRIRIGNADPDQGEQNLTIKSEEMCYFEVLYVLCRELKAYTYCT